MTVLARVGAILLIAGIVAFGIWAIGFSGPAGPPGPGGEGGTRSDTLLVTAFCLLLGAGAGTLGIAARPPFASRLIRVGLGAIGAGMLSVALGRTIVVIPTGSNELSSLPYLILVFGGGLMAVAGLLVCGASLARSALRRRRYHPAQRG